jgi:HD-like signal output (HDOD) protein
LNGLEQRLPHLPTHGNHVMNDNDTIGDDRDRMLGDWLQRRIERRELKLPMLPQVVTDVLRLAGDDDADLRDLAGLIERDQSLAGHVLRTAQAAAFAGAPIASLRAALQRLGMRNTAAIAVAAALGPKLFVARGCEELVQALWRESLATALWARELALCNRVDAELAFLCGLLHRIGHPVVLHEVMEATLRLDVRVDPPPLSRLLVRFGTPVGIELAGHWQMPPAVVATIAALGGAEAPADCRRVVETVLTAAQLAADDDAQPALEEAIATRLASRRGQVGAMIAALC